MSLLFWNCHELGNLCTRKELEVVVRAKDPSAIFLPETWADKTRFKRNQMQSRLREFIFCGKKQQRGRSSTILERFD